MYAVNVRVRVDRDREEEARTLLREVVVPTAKGMDGFISGTWLRALDDDRGTSVLIFESEAGARAAGEWFRTEGPPPGAPVAVESADPFEVVAQA